MPVRLQQAAWDWRKRRACGERKRGIARRRLTATARPLLASMYRALCAVRADRGPRVAESHAMTRWSILLVIIQVFATSEHPAACAHHDGLARVAARILLV